MEGRGLKPMQLTGNVAENWTQFKQKFGIFSAAIELGAKSEETQCAQLLFQMGEEVIDIFNTFIFMDDEKNKIAKLMEKFDNCFLPIKNITYERYKFFTSRQNDKTVEEFVLTLKDQVGKCSFPDDTFKTELIKCMLIVGINDEKVKEQLLHKEHTLQKAIEVCNLGSMQSLQNDLSPTFNQNLSDEDNNKKQNSKRKRNNKELNITKCDADGCKMVIGPQIDPNVCFQDGDMEIDKARSEATFRFSVKEFSKLKDSDLESPAFYVRNLPWKILVQPSTEPAQGQTPATRSLGFYLKCNNGSKSTSWSCYAVAELRLLSVQTSIKPFSIKIQHLFYNKANDWGYKQFMTWNDVLDKKKGYIKDDTITLEVIMAADPPHGVSWDSKKDTVTDGVKKQKKVPGNWDKNTALEQLDINRSNATFRFNVPILQIINLKNKGTILSSTCYVRNLPWKIGIQREADFLGVYLYCTGEINTASPWYCSAIGELRLIPIIFNAKMISKPIEQCVFDHKGQGWGYSKFIKLKEVVDVVEKGYIENDSIAFEVFFHTDVIRVLMK